MPPRKLLLLLGVVMAAAGVTLWGGATVLGGSANYSGTIAIVAVVAGLAWRVYSGRSGGK